MFTSQGFAETEYKCADLANHVNSDLIKINKQMKETFKQDIVTLTTAYCDTNSNGDARLNYSSEATVAFKLDRKNLISLFCSNSSKIQILFDYVKEVRYLYYSKKSGNKLGEVKFFKKTCK